MNDNYMDIQAVAFQDIDGAGITVLMSEIAAVQVKYQSASFVFRRGATEGWRVPEATARRVEEQWEGWRISRAGEYASQRRGRDGRN